MASGPARSISWRARVQADPDSFDLRYDLGKAYASVNAQSSQAIAAFEAAAKIKPDDIEVQTELGREYLASDRPDEAMLHLRLAIQTDDYKTDDEAAALADFFLARALQQKGYDRAAVDEYDSLLRRLARPSMEMRQPRALLHRSAPRIALPGSWPALRKASRIRFSTQGVSVCR